jgi:hypothetical protein
MPRYPHLYLENAADTARYTATRGHSPKFNLPDRTRATHATQVIGALQTAQRQREPFPVQVGNGLYESPGLILAFESDPNFPLAFESLELRKSGIQLLSVVTDAENRTIATVRVPDNKMVRLLRVMEAYRDATPGKRDNKKLIESIANIKLATLYELWTDDADLYPLPNTTFAWEVWLRRPEEGESAPIERLRKAAGDFGYDIISNVLTFVDRTVVLVRGTREQLSLSAEVLGIIAEVRKAKVTADFYSTRNASDQNLVVDEAVARLSLPATNSPVIGLLDTGVNRGHPLLSPVVSDDDVQGLKPGWGGHDTYHHGHGTQMAGLAIYGDLTDVLAQQGPIELTHGVQSLKLIHTPDPHHPDLYGTVTIEGISRLEVETTRRKVYCMAITADARDRGRPSSWSAAIDDLAFGTINDTPRLILISAGNTGLADRADYPDYNETASVQDPAQSWNALTVGGYTERAFIDIEKSPGWTPMAIQGDLAPASTTSLTWPRSNKTPLKPDIVMEAGNMGSPPGGGDPDFLPELQILTTNNVFTAGEAPLVDFHDTSAATALAANLACRLIARYPEYAPETVRGFMVHSARWTDAMLARVRSPDGTFDTTRLLRTFGYGLPNPEMLFYSAQNNLTLVAEDTIRPFFEDEDGTIKSFDIKFHELPWPREALEALPFDTPIEMRVTLSYFIEPSPGERGWERKYGYPSHGLRFKVIRPTETLEQFKLRINTHDRDDDYDEDHVDETGSWELGTGKPTNGCVHSNTWHGSAAELARRGHIAIHPTMGWWRTRKKERRFERSIRYSLIVSIHTPREEIDIYTPVAVQVGIEVPIEI